MWKIGRVLRGHAGLAVCLLPPQLPAGHGAHGLVFVSAAPTHQLIQIESPREGIATWKTYHTYIKASGGLV